MLQEPLVGAPRRRPRSPSTAPRTRLLDATLACIARVGVSKTTLDDVAREAGCSRATLYRYFPGKPPLAAARSSRREAGRARARARRPPRPTPRSLEDAVVAIVLRAAAWLGRPARVAVRDDRRARGAAAAPRVRRRRPRARTPARSVVAPALARVPRPRRRRARRRMARPHDPLLRLQPDRSRSTSPTRSPFAGSWPTSSSPVSLPSPMPPGGNAP